MPFLFFFSIDLRLDTLSHVDQEFPHGSSLRIIRGYICAEQTWNYVEKLSFFFVVYYMYMWKKASKHRASSLSSTYHACRNILADTRTESTSDGGRAARYEAYSKGVYDNKDIETPP